MPRRLAGPVRHINPNSAEGRRAFENAKRPRRFGGTVKQALERRRPLALGEREEYLTKTQRDALRTRTNKLDQITDFRKWLALFFVTRGHYKLTEKGIGEFGRDDRQRQHMEFAERYESREREERTELIYRQTKEQRKEKAEEVISKMLDEGQAEYLIDNGYIKSGKRSWKEKEVRVQVIRRLVEGKEVRGIRQGDFYKNGLTGFISNLYKGSPYRALVEAGYAYSEDEIGEHAKTGEFETEKIYPWEMDSTPTKVYNKKEIRVAAVKWLVWKVKKGIRETSYDDFYNNGLGGLIGGRYKDSPYLALAEAGYAYTEDELKKHGEKGEFGTEKIYPWEMERSPNRVYNKKETRVAAVKWLIGKVKKEIKEIGHDDFSDHGLRGLIARCNNSVYLALVEGGYAYPEGELNKHAKTGEFGTEKIYPWEMEIAPQGIYQKKRMRVAAVIWLVWKTGINAKELTQKYFEDDGLDGLLTNHYDSSPYLAVLEAGLVTKTDEAYMRSKGHAH